jgi:hypothetical protein
MLWLDPALAILPSLLIATLELIATKTNKMTMRCTKQLALENSKRYETVAWLAERMIRHELCRELGRLRRTTHEANLQPMLRQSSWLCWSSSTKSGGHALELHL